MWFFVWTIRFTTKHFQSYWKDHSFQFVMLHFLIYCQTSVFWLRYWLQWLQSFGSGVFGLTCYTDLRFNVPRNHPYVGSIALNLFFLKLLIRIPIGIQIRFGVFVFLPEDRLQAIWRLCRDSWQSVSPLGFHVDYADRSLYKAVVRSFHLHMRPFCDRHHWGSCYFSVLVLNNENLVSSPFWREDRFDF